MKPYRGKTYDGDWIYGWYVHLEDKHVIISEDTYIGYSTKSIDGAIEVDPDTVGQYVTTYNNQEIYEGDFIKDEDGRLFEIKLGEYLYDNSDVQIHTVGFYTVISDDNETWNFPFYLEEGDEIIGNIHDNPELLKED